MTNRFKDKVVIVTGGGTGIGRATAVQLGREGAKVAVVARTAQTGEETVETIKAAGGEAIYIQGDVSLESDIIKYVEQTLAAFGRIDALFNNAGMSGDLHPLTEYPVELFDKVIATNLRSVFLGMRHVIPHLLKNGGGSILNCSSIHGTIGMAGNTAYSASKHGVIGLTKSAALEWGPANIRINAICPGPTHSVMMHRFEGLISDNVDGIREMISSETALKRYGQPEEIAELASFLLSDQASYITGSVHIADGGFTAG